MSRFCLMLSRLCLSAWVGIALFFVFVVLDLRRSDLFDPTAKLNHPKVLFPLYYGFEFALLGTSLACGIAAEFLRSVRNRCFRIGLSLLVVALATAAGDYLVIYRPLSQMIAGSNLPAEFASYHRWSIWINAVDLIVCAAAAICLQWPESDMRSIRIDEARGIRG